MKIMYRASFVAALGTFSALSACMESVETASAPVSEGVPAFSASCPNFIEVNSDGDGRVFINAQPATVTAFSGSFYEAVQGDVTLSISQDGSGNVAVSYNKRGVGNGVCTIN